MRLTFPWALIALLALPVLVWRYRALLQGQDEQAAALARTGLVPVSSGDRRRGRHLVPLLLAAALTALIVASSGPVATLRQVHPEGTVILAFDVSNSMQATDVKPDRLTAAKEAARRFVEAQPGNVRIGIVAFGDTAIVTQAPTDDPVALSGAIDRLTSRGGTAIGQGIFVALKAISGNKLTVDAEQLVQDPESVDIGYYGSGRIVLLSDGENTGEIDPMALARLASVAGVRIETIGLGQPGGADVEIDGVTQHTSLDEKLLTDIATATDGHFQRGESAAELGDMYAGLDLELVSRREPTELAPYITLLAILILLSGVGISLIRTGKVVSA
ncbi:MAG: VWA domain-containing protein [Tetrasphaera sp.]